MPGLLFWHCSWRVVLCLTCCSLAGCLWHSRSSAVTSCSSSRTLSATAVSSHPSQWMQKRSNISFHAQQGCRAPQALSSPCLPGWKMCFCCHCHGGGEHDPACETARRGLQPEQGDLPFPCPPRCVSRAVQLHPDKLVWGPEGLCGVHPLFPARTVLKVSLTAWHTTPR